MRYLIYLSALLFSSQVYAQNVSALDSDETVVVDNEKMKVVKYTSKPKGDVCGKGMHFHEPHLTVVLSDAKVHLTSEDGKSQDIEVEKGTSIWFEAETHAAVNHGHEPTEMLLVFLKE